jgi:5'-nucleotidase
VTLQILLTNDDGIDSPGIAALRRAVDGLGDVHTIAPDRNNSAVARGITITRPLHLTPARFGDGLGFSGLACDGTPSDCVRVALLGGPVPEPDLVLSGVNLGANMGTDITYSGTVGAALEAALRGKPALAFSVEALQPSWLREAEPIVRALVADVIAHGLPRHSILNVNLPDRPVGAMAGIRPARLGGASCRDRLVLDGDGASPAPPAAGREYYLPCEESSPADWTDTDVELVGLGYVAVTPVHYDLLDATMLAELSTWDLDLARIRAAARS